ncbi:glycoside hydrolase superfamily [Collybia nuda]|uniref:Glycoside hydrolase superfamily n=1 Tax=Collybia nuda TaxID=64659 RepID=A0A9P5XYT4_9AGAR|nr:glycoside hydrolase superfamily [Collybia nuda]
MHRVIRMPVSWRAALNTKAKWFYHTICILPETCDEVFHINPRDRICGVTDSTCRHSTISPQHSWRDLGGWSRPFFSRRVQCLYRCFRLNAGLDCNKLSIGMSHPIPVHKPNPDGSCKDYKVVSGDTCSALALKYSITVDDIVAWNKAARTYKWTTCSALPVGYNICVSNGGAPPVPVNPNLQCGPESPGNSTCPLNACCSAFGFCGITKEFCDTEGANPCLSNCFMPTLPSCKGSAKRSLGYYAGWANRRSCGAVGPNQIDLTGLTHINFAFAVISKDYKISISDDDDSLLKRLVFRKGEVTGLKVLIALGGWAFSEEDPTKDLFTVMIASSANRATFISSVESFLKKYNLDGIDIDFEYPGASERSAPATETPDLTAFFKELRAGLPSALISVATPAGYWFLKGFEINKIMNYVDWASMMSYDFHGQWDTNVTGQPSVANPHTSLLDMKDSALLYRRAGIDLANVNLGLAWYARTFHLTPASCGKYNCTMDGGGSSGKCSNTSGYLTQFETYYFMHGSDLVSFDEDETWKTKKDFAGNTCFGGTFV